MLSEALLVFVFLGLFSPGPNVILLTASGARFGFTATVPHLLGVALGVGVVAGVTGFGLGTLLLAYPTLQLALKITAFLWMLWMAWGMWQANPARSTATDRPFTFTEAVLFQAVNPKIWAVALSATSFVATLPPVDQATALALTFSGVNLCVCLFWTKAGSMLSKLLASPRAWQIFMRIMALALAFFSLTVFL